MSEPTPFTIDVPQERIDAIVAKVRAYEWHEMPEIEPGGDRWAYGTDMEYLKELCAYWVDGFDWRKAEALLNSQPQFIATIDGLDIHFLHVKGSGSNPKPVLMTHGWPGSVFEFYDVIDRLAHPENHGGNAEDGLTLVMPTLPGYGFSGKPKKPVGQRATAALWDKLMREVLGYQRYVAQGGDWGSLVSGWVAFNHSVAKGGGCEAVHLNMFGVRAPGIGPETDEEIAWFQTAAITMELESAYMRQQMTRPQTLSYGMMDSPVGAAGWIIEKFHNWSDGRGPDGVKHIENAFSKDQLLTNLMIYLVTRSFNTATWYYRGAMEEGSTELPAGEKVEVPTAIAAFPKEFLTFPPRRIVEAAYNVTRWTEFDRGGHFAAMEEPEIFAKEVRAFVSEL